jgi:hypothetical protein
MQKLVLAMTLLIALGVVAISGSLYAGHHKSTMTSTNAMDPAALTLQAKDLPVIEVAEPY